jgi:DNA-directed RNA polymerase specialized sigma24 family protein
MGISETAKLDFIAYLTPIERTILQLRYVDELLSSEIAELLQLTENCVEVTLWVLRNRLQTLSRSDDWLERWIRRANSDELA